MLDSPHTRILPSSQLTGLPQGQHVLRVVRGATAPQTVVLSEDITRIGRHPDCTLRLESQTVSKVHAQIVREGSLFYVVDMDSTNGTLLNGRRLPPREPRDLKPGDSIVMSDHEMVYQVFPRDQAIPPVRIDHARAEKEASDALELLRRQETPTSDSLGETREPEEDGGARDEGA